MGMKKKYDYSIRVIENTTKCGDIFYTLERRNNNHWFPDWSEISLNDFAYILAGGSGSISSIVYDRSIALAYKKKLEDMYDRWKQEDDVQQIVKKAVVE